MNKKVLLYVILTALCFGTLEISGKIAGNSLDIFQFTFWRFFIGSFCLVPIALSEQKEARKLATEENRVPYKLTFVDALIVIGAGILCAPVSMGLCQAGIVRSNAATAAVILGTNGMFAMVFAHFLGGEKMSTRKWCLLLLAMVGLTFMICPWDLQPGNTILGAMLVLSGAMLFGLYTVIGKFAAKKMGAITQCCASIFSGAIVLLIFLIVSGRPVFDGVLDNIAVVIYAGIVVTGGGYLFMFLTIKHSNVQTSAISFFLKIALAPILSVVILGESLTWNCFVGILCVLTSSFLNLRRPKQAK